MIVAFGNRCSSEAAAASSPVAFVAMMPRPKSGRSNAAVAAVGVP